MCTQCPGTAGLFKLQTRINPLLRCGGALRGNHCSVSHTPSPQAPQDLALLPPSPPTLAQMAPGRRRARESCAKGQGDVFQMPALTRGWAGGFPMSRLVMGGREVAVPDFPPTPVLSKALLWMLSSKHAFCSLPVFTVSATPERSCRSCRHF